MAKPRLVRAKDWLPEKPFSVRIRWGTSDGKTRTYRFRWSFELRAFLKGIKAAIGWHDYEILNLED